MPLAKRLPKVGFRSKRPILNQVVDLKQLNQLENGAVINVAFLKSQGLIESIHKPFKILGDGELKKSVVIEEGVSPRRPERRSSRPGVRFQRHDRVIRQLF